MPEPGIIRAIKDRNNPYTMVSRAIAQDKRLSWEARGVLLYLLSKPDDWEVRFSDLLRQGPGGEDRLRRILKELETWGYLDRQCLQGPDGRFSWVTNVYEVPANPVPCADFGQPDAGFPGPAEPRPVLPGGENRHIYKVETLRNTDLLNREGESAPPPPVDFESFTVDNVAVLWWETIGLPAGAVDVPTETEKWRDAIRAGHRPHPADPAADWRIWMRRAVSHYQKHGGPTNGPSANGRHSGSPQSPAQSPSPAAEQRAAADLVAALDALAGPRRPPSDPPGAGPVS